MLRVALSRARSVLSLLFPLPSAFLFVFLFTACYGPSRPTSLETHTHTHAHRHRVTLRKSFIAHPHVVGNSVASEETWQVLNCEIVFALTHRNLLPWNDVWKWVTASSSIYQVTVMKHNQVVNRKYCLSLQWSPAVSQFLWYSNVDNTRWPSPIEATSYSTCWLLGASLNVCIDCLVSCKAHVLERSDQWKNPRYDPSAKVADSSWNTEALGNLDIGANEIQWNRFVA